ncbi:ATP-binding cassette domain-containing protein [Microlunatus speluncae]|uniref:ATP-binding cassette domain-containing protein n=1 Tax=Microlunatus speluncae TaxID=2594267 RepID=UPI0012660AAB|nr:ATP-binding cassette domain-containing protein [Microlunatus speluncae]
MTEPTVRPVILAAENLIKDFRVSQRGRVLTSRRNFRAVDDVTLTVREAETVGLVGESGSGKSTTARMVGRLVDVTAGRVRLGDLDVTTATGPALREFRRSVQFVFQDPYSSLNPRQNVEELVSAPLRYQGISTLAGSVTRVKELMERVGLDPDHSRRYPAQFSGGQAQRIGIARAIACNPKMIICDEPVSALDVSVQAQVLRLLSDLQDDFGFSYLFISHDLAVVRQVAQRVCVMQDGKIVEEGERDQIFAEPRHDYTRTLLAAVPTIPAEWERERRTREGSDDRQPS